MEEATRGVKVAVAAEEEKRSAAGMRGEAAYRSIRGEGGFWG
jgi:hypothetical protein